MASLAPTPFRLEVRDIATIVGQQNLDLHPDLVVLVGANNSGKSTLLRAIDAPRRILSGVSDFRSVPARFGSLASDAFLHFNIDLQTEHFTFDFAQFRQVAIKHQGVSLNFGDPLSLVLSAHNANGFRWPNHLMTVTHGSDGIVGGVFLDDRTRANANAPVGHVQDAGRLVDMAAESVRKGVIAAWGHTDVDFYDATGDRRMRGSTEARLRRTLTSLRLNFPHEFEKLQDALTRSLPEFGRIAFDEDSGRPDTYIPQLELRGTTVALKRENIGAGSWTFLCVLAAARMAHATGALVMLLDEPTLFMHPQLERELLRELREPSAWDGKPMKLVIAAHSPILVDAAFDCGGLRILDWRDRAKAETEIVNVTSDQDLSRHFAASHTSAGEMVYAETPLFVEGPSDYAVLRMLERKVAVPCRVFVLEAKDSYAGRAKKDREHALQMLKRLCELRLLGRFTKPRVMFDADAKEAVRIAASKLQEATIPTLHFVGKPDSDLESVFCEPAFLTAFFLNASARRQPRDVVELSSAISARLSSPTKGSSVLYPLFQDFFGEPEDKPEQLAEVVSYLLETENAPESAAILRALAPVLAVLDAKTDLASLREAAESPAP